MCYRAWSIPLEKIRKAFHVCSNSFTYFQRRLQRAERSIWLYVRLFADYSLPESRLTCKSTQEDELASRTSELLEDEAPQVLQLLIQYSQSSGASIRPMLILGSNLGVQARPLPILNYWNVSRLGSVSYRSVALSNRRCWTPSSMPCHRITRSTQPSNAFARSFERLEMSTSANRQYKLSILA